MTTLLSHSIAELLRLGIILYQNFRIIFGQENDWIKVVFTQEIFRSMDHLSNCAKMRSTWFNSYVHKW